MTEFRPTMQERKKWAEHAKNLRVGDLVVLADPNNPRGHWPLGRILTIFEATDGVVCSAIVKMDRPKSIALPPKSTRWTSSSVCGTHTGPAMFLTEHDYLILFRVPSC